MAETKFPSCLTIGSKKTLVIGIGGGYDVYTCLPWFLQLSLEEQEHCVIGNYTFTDDIHKYTKDEDSYVAEIKPDTVRTMNNSQYFPELHLAQKLNRSIYAFRLMPCPMLINILLEFVLEHQIEQMFLFDGGIDSIIFGDEGLVYGSPLEDSQMIIACAAVASKNNLPSVLVTSAVGIDDCDIKSYMNHWDLLTCANATYGKFKLTSDLPNFKTYEDICQTSDPSSIIQESIIAAANGILGLYLNPRLYPSRIADKNDLPLIREETSFLWFWDPVVLVEISPFYQHMLKFLELLNEKSPNECWIHWNQYITLFMEATPVSNKSDL